jgi:predicted ThiF/HesA family dinucleotide-utilizing enzyme
VSDALGIARWQLRAALHLIKHRSNLGGQDRVVVYDDGRVTDASGDDIGNILDEVTDD